MKLKNKFVSLSIVLATTFAALPIVAASCGETANSTTTPPVKVENKVENKTESKVENKSDKSTTATTETKTNEDLVKLSVAALSNVWNTLSAEKDAMSWGQYQAGKKQYDAMVKQSMITTDKVAEPTTGSKYMNVQNPQEGKSIPVVWMDLDETVLNNFAFQNYNILNGKTFTPQVWEKFVLDKKSTEVAGSFDFIRYVWNHGGVVMYNSNREQKTQLEASIENLKQLGLEEKYLPKWAFWMQRTDLTKSDPWNHIATKKSEKEERMHLASTKTFDLSAYGSGNAVKFKSVMRIGDNFDDLNDNASAGKSNEERIKVFEKIKNLLGNFDINVKGKYFNPTTKQWEDQTWSESYIQIGGNTNYGGFEKAIAPNYYRLSEQEKNIAIKKILSKLMWQPKS